VPLLRPSQFTRQRKAPCRVAQTLGLIAAVLALFVACSSRSVLLATSTDNIAGAGAAGQFPQLGAAGTAGMAGAPGSTTATPILIGTIDLSSSGPGIRLLVGDVTGDGRYDIVAMQPDKVPDGTTPHAVVALTAFELDGQKLWQFGTPDPSITGSKSDIPAQIYDIDGDGFNEVVAVIADKFLVIDGRTGKAKSEYDLPDPNAHDAIAFANFSGHRRPDDIILKDRFTNLWAFDSGFRPLFKYTGALGYYPWPHDWDGDGRDEVVTACRFLDGDGTLVWSCDATVGDVQVDAVWAADLDPDVANGTEVIIGAGDVFAFDTKGTLLWRADTAEAQNLVVGDFRPDLPGLEIGGLDRVQRGANGTDAVFLISSTGKLLFHEERPEGSGWSTIVTMMRDWDGTRRELLVAYGRAGVAPTLYDGQFNVVASFPDQTAQLIPADLCGDSRQEIVAFTDSTAHLYATAPCDLTSHVNGKPQPQTKYLYNWTRYWGGEYP
jgi:outer membrane protein assembly factor BamB